MVWLLSAWALCPHALSSLPYRSLTAFCDSNKMAIWSAKKAREIYLYLTHIRDNQFLILEIPFLSQAKWAWSRWPTLLERPGHEASLEALQEHRRESNMQKGQAVGNLRTYLTPRRVIQNIHQDDGEHATVPVADVDYDANPNSSWKTIEKVWGLKSGRAIWLLIYMLYLCSSVLAGIRIPTSQRWGNGI